MPLAPGARPEAFARDPERLARFAREAKVLAYGLEESGITRALVLELVEGRHWRLESHAAPQRRTAS